jgi:hypothetical protein
MRSRTDCGQAGYPLPRLPIPSTTPALVSHSSSESYLMLSHEPVEPEGLDSSPPRIFHRSHLARSGWERSEAPIAAPNHRILARSLLLSINFRPISTTHPPALATWCLEQGRFVADISPTCSRFSTFHLGSTKSSRPSISCTPVISASETGTARGEQTFQLTVEVRSGSTKTDTSSV